MRPTGPVSRFGSGLCCRTLVRLGLLVFLASSSCLSPEPSATGPEPLTVVQLEAERRMKMAGIRPQTVIEAVEAPTAEVPRIPSLVLGAHSREQVDRSAVPVLLPNRTGLLESVRVITSAHWYSASMREQGLNVVITGNRKAVVWPHLEREHPNGLAAYQTAAHGIRTVSFKRFGVAYSLHIECDAVENDERCREPAFLWTLHRTLAVAEVSP